MGSYRKREKARNFYEKRVCTGYWEAAGALITEDEWKRDPNTSIQVKEDDEEGAELVEKGGSDRTDETEGREGDGDDDEGESAEQVLVDDADGAGGEHEQIGEAAEVVRHEGDVRGVDGDIVPEGAHGDSEIAFREGGRVVQSVADDHDPASGGFEGADVGEFAFREAVGFEIGDADVGGDVLGDFRPVSGEHDEIGDAEGAEAGEGFAGFRADAIGKEEGGDVLSCDGEQD